MTAKFVSASLALLRRPLIVAEIPSSSHHPMLEVPLLFVAMLNAWMANKPRRPTSKSPLLRGAKTYSASGIKVRGLAVIMHFCVIFPGKILFLTRWSELRSAAVTHRGRYRGGRHHRLLKRPQQLHRSSDFCPCRVCRANEQQGILPELAAFGDGQIYSVS
ncbi:MAG: hypothetical protein ACRD06_00460 [Terriglobia bacterium]